ncbi:hypothetical protein PCC7424_1735 [Gloeothece citriformis PCC 7424]|uniref:eCIS core domain-containing protein n=1 Tax=Gloeothece citriformis (strain PCC 7424) TaxID=65393 RepID=B7KB60_GLOC7|nr:DUF4157 domain-containing protein [Gloeothece citriformis]ACK70170.1 hypothetical protein PCC7424_1735 [Gloeothece citriformis PCC 7424]
MVFERPQKRASQEPQGRFSSQVFQRQYFSDEEEKQIRNRPMPVGMFNYAATLPTAPYSEPVQAKAEESVTQTVSPEAEGMGTENEAVIQEKSEEKPNLTGLPDELKAGVENLSGYSLDDVRVHYNSPKPAQLQALAYTQGREIHVAPGQEEHLPHEAWHVVQQIQGRVKPTMQMKGVQINDDKGLEREADVNGKKASTKKWWDNHSSTTLSQSKRSGEAVSQLMGRNVLYRGPEIMIKLYRGSDYTWEMRAMQTGRLISKGLREFKGKAPLEMVAHTMDTHSGEFAPLDPRELRNRHAKSSSKSTGEKPHTPTSNYVSLTDDPERAIEWATIIYRFDIWRSDVWKGGVDYDRGGPEREWLAEGNTKIYNVEFSRDQGKSWNPVDQELDSETTTLFEKLQHVK